MSAAAILVTGGLGVAAVAAVFANHHWHWVAGWRYDWVHARHMLPSGAAPGGEAPEFGSMILAEERALYEVPVVFLPAPDPVPWRDLQRAEQWDWRDQTAADLSPEALNDQPDPYLDALTAEYGSEFDDSGPGGFPSLTPGPDPGRLCGPEQPHEKPAGTESAGSGHLERLADTGDIASARLLADIEDELRAQDDDAAEYLSRYRTECIRMRLDLTAALA